MKTIPVEQISTMPMLVIFELLTALITLTVGMVIVNRVMKKNTRKKLVFSGLVGVITGAAMLGVFFGVSHHVESTNISNLRAAVAESGEKITEEQFSTLKSEEAINLAEDKFMSFTDDGKDSSLTILDLSENEKTQSQEDKDRQKQIEDNDF
jgi:hypothetical protein